MSLLLRGGRVVDPSQDLDAVCDLLIGDDGRVARIAESLDEAGSEILEVAGKVVVPGLIDVHVHLREPGQEYKETLRTGTRAAAAGGFTAVACMANTVPPNDSRSVTEHIVLESRRHRYARVYPVGAVSKGLAGDELAEIGDMVAAGIVAISDDGRPVADAELMRRALELAQHFDIPVVQHAQDLQLSACGVMHEGAASVRVGLPGMPGAAEDVMVARDLILVEDTGGRYHLQHLSTRRSLDLIRAAKRRNLRVTTEVTPHHLLLTDQAVVESALSPNWKMNPPLRGEDDRLAMIEGLQDGSIDLIASDHAPHHADEKLLDFVDAPFGIVGLETTVSLCLDRLVRTGLLSLSRLVELLSCAPARIFALPGGSLRPGTVGDVTLLDLEREVVVVPERFESKSRNTPFAGWRLRGAPAGTVMGGRLVTL